LRNIVDRQRNLLCGFKLRRLLPERCSNLRAILPEPNASLQGGSFCSAANNHLSLPLLALLALMSGCAAPSSLIHTPEVIREHVIAVDGRGRPHDPATDNGREYTMKEYRAQLAKMLRALRAFHQSHPDGKVLLFVHGGLNPPAESLQSADSELDRVIAAGYFPIYLDWNSDLFSSYGEHIANITQGQSDQNFGRGLQIPLYVLADIVRAAARAPIVWVNQGTDDAESAVGDIVTLPKQQQLATTLPSAQNAQSQRWAQSRHGQAVAQTYEQLRAAQKQEEQTRGVGDKREQLRIFIGPDLDVAPSHLGWLVASYILTAPVKFLSQPIIDWLGTPAWQNMSRRTLMAYDGDLGSNPNNPNLDPELLGRRELRAARAIDFSSTGALEVFREELEKVVANHHAGRGAASQPEKPSYDITLVGHSMGTMVLNEWLRRDLLESKHQAYSNIVYMGAACSIRDFGRAVVPYLLQHSQTQFYNLMLHPLAELRERSRGYDLPPRGSLLVWLDSFLTDPQTPLDRTLGRWANIISATEMIPQSVRGQVTLKAFALAPYDAPIPPPGKPDYGPQEHGQFRGRPYWCKAFWASEDVVVTGDDCGHP